MKQGAHGGNVYEAAEKLNVTAEDIYDYSSNISPFQVKVLKGEDLNTLLSRLPEPHSKTLRRSYEEKYELPENSAVITAGTTEAIERLCRIYSDKKALILSPTYSDYEHYCRIYGLETGFINLSEGSDFSFSTSGFHSEADICFICNPNNPTGKSTDRREILKLCAENRKTLFVVDESYVWFHKNPYKISVLGANLQNLITLRSYSKTYGLPGLRVAAAVSHNSNLIDSLRSLISPWSVNCAAQSAGLELLNADVSEEMAKLRILKEKFMNTIKDIPYICAIESDVNYILFKLKGVKSHQLFDHCLKGGVLIRDCSNFRGLDDSYVRFAVSADMEPLIKSLRGFSK